MEKKIWTRFRVITCSHVITRVVRAPVWPAKLARLAEVGGAK